MRWFPVAAQHPVAVISTNCGTATVAFDGERVLFMLREGGERLKCIHALGAGVYVCMRLREPACVLCACACVYVLCVCVFSLLIRL